MLMHIDTFKKCGATDLGYHTTLGDLAYKHSADQIPLPSGVKKSD